jgi:hypothetical protein
VTAKARLLRVPLCWRQGRRLATGDALGREPFRAIGILVQQTCCRPGSRRLYYGGGRSGRVGNWVDESALQGTRQTYTDENHHLAKVRVAGSNPITSIICG